MGTQLSGVGGGDSGGGGMDYMSGIAKIGGTLNNTWDQYHGLFQELGVLGGKTPEQESLDISRDKLDLDKLNSTASRGATVREQNMSGLGFLANQRAQAQQQGNLSAFKSALYEGIGR